MRRHLPNLITLGRLLAVPVTIWLILEGEMLWAFWLFVGAGASDALDGLLARAWGARSFIGAVLDPIADKMLLVTVFLALAKAGELPNWLVILVVSRDVMIVGGVVLLYVLGEAVRMEPSRVSKLNTVFQSLLAATVLGRAGFGLEGIGPFSNGLVWLTAATTLLSGAAYLAKGWQRLLLAPEGGDDGLGGRSA